MKTTKKRFFSILFVLALVIGFLTAGKVLADGATKKETTSRALTAQNEVYFEILPEILLEDSNAPNMPKLLTPNSAIGVWRNTMVFGGPLKNEAKTAWENVYFNVYNEDRTLNERTNGTIGGRWSGAKYLGPYEKGKKYTIEVDASTLPPYYYSWFTQEKMGEDPEYLLKVKSDRGDIKALYDGKGTKTYAVTRFHMEMVSIAFVKNEDVGKNQFILNGEGKVTGRNRQYVDGTDYILKTIGTDHKLPTLTEAEKEKLADEGNWPVGFYFYYKSKGKPDVKLPQRAIRPQEPEYGFLRSWNDSNGINTNYKFNSSSIYTLILEQRIPVVSFYKNEGSAQVADKTLLGTRKVYYKHSLADNCLSNGTCLPKDLPVNPTRAGMVFSGWNTKPDGTGEAFTANSMVKEDMKVYAQWKKPTPPTPKPDHKPTTPILRIIKIDGDGNRIPLPVTFKITDKMFPAINRVVTTDKSGEAKVAYLTTGDYSLEEIKTPEGYVPLDKPLSFSIKDGLIRYENDIVRTIYVKNDKKTEEPDVIKPIDDPTRQDIAATISKTYFGDAKKVILVQNMAYADSMSAMNVSQGNIPILYTQKDALFDVTKQEILRTGRDEIIVMGGTNTISEKVIAELKAITGAKITRVDGVDRFEVNKNSAAYLPESTNAVIASGMIYTDALSSVPYAHQWKAPILLVRQDRVPNFVADVLKARISNAVISGGKRTIGPETKQAIETMIGKTVSRVDGADRYVVSAKMAKMVTNPTSAIITSGEKWSDALVAGPVAQKLNAPVLLTRQSHLPMPIDAYLNTHTNLKQILLIGGPASVGESVRNTLKAIFTVK
ncbi:cell wall-binding repeat-containing protein [Levyella massiliensis]|uniref:cell wall-binding repeat-containing protein n=1 Tax=Levyella massiliensis TaxID=938289 RepID=UPI00036DB0E3|nr:cell wall-binding repeat-containing protein [Levyella massiliensis]